MSVKLRKKALKNGKKSLYLDIYHDKKRKYEYLNLYVEKAQTPLQKQSNKETITLAENIRAKREVEINTTANGFNPMYKNKTDFFQFAKQLNDKNIGKSSHNYYKATIEHFKNFLGKDTIPIGSIDSKLVEEYKDYLFNLPELNNSTPFSYFARFKTIFKAAISPKYGIILINPTDNVENGDLYTSQKTFLTIDEIQLLSQTPCKNNEVKRAFLFACNTGLRHVDIKNLTWANIVNNTIQIRQQKTGEPVYLPLNGNAIKLLGERNEPQQKIFETYNSVGHCNIYLKQWAKEAGINKDLTFHVARHSFATNRSGRASCRERV